MGRKKVFAWFASRIFNVVNIWYDIIVEKFLVPGKVVKRVQTFICRASLEAVSKQWKGSGAVRTQRRSPFNA